jgi:hypothetical protein
MGFFLLSLYWGIELLLKIDWKHFFLIVCPTLLPKPSVPTSLGVKPVFYAFELSSINEFLAFILRDFNLIFC